MHLFADHFIAPNYYQLSEAKSRVVCSVPLLLAQVLALEGHKVLNRTTFSYTAV